MTSPPGETATEDAENAERDDASHEVQNERYRLVERISQPLESDDTQTWLGIDLRLNRPVTVRLFGLGTEVGQRLRLQTQALAALEHPSLLHILDTYSQDRQLAVVTERIPAHTLADELDDEGEFARLTTQEALAATREVAGALDALHATGFTHGGVNAAQVARRREGGFMVITGPPTADAVSIPATKRADLRSLGALVHELLVGVPPTDREGRQWKLASALSLKLREKLLVLDSPEGARAWSGAVPLAEELARSARGADGRAGVDLSTGAAQLPKTQTQEPHPQQAQPRWYRRRWLPSSLVVAAAAVLTAVLLGSLWLLNREDSPSAAAETEPVTATAPAADDLAATDLADPTDPAIPPAKASPENSTTNSTRNSTDTSAENPNDPNGTPTEAAEPTIVPVEITQITDFDPLGEDTFEHPELLLSLNDGDPSTGWRTSLYRTAQFGGLKEGLGLLISLAADPPPRLVSLVIESPSVGWSFQLLSSAETRPNRIVAWGDPVAERTVAEAAAGRIQIDLEELEAATLLVWITDLGDELPSGEHRVTITGVHLSRLHIPAVEQPTE